AFHGVVQHADTALQQTGHAVQHAVDFTGAAVAAAFVDARQAGVDDRSGAAGLTDDRVFCHSDPPAFLEWSAAPGTPCEAGDPKPRAGPFAARTANCTFFVVLSVPCAPFFCYCRSCRKNVRAFVKLYVPYGGTMQRHTLPHRDKCSALWNIRSCYKNKLNKVMKNIAKIAVRCKADRKNRTI